MNMYICPYAWRGQTIVRRGGTGRCRKPRGRSLCKMGRANTLKMGTSIRANDGGARKMQGNIEQQEEVKRWVQSSSPLCLP
ncbi:hypothetical protein [Geobacillus sp. B4113_201601]|uniref:hypothetical protein n=1 Tax=Geobacillus sp. B4113_201601 TaxID=1586290 RepID=UPI000ABA4BDA|nr:hypothetical protein [Geobacillus sp. B4113_201601]